MCDCAKAIDVKLAERGGRLSRGFKIDPELGLSCRLMVQTEKIDKSKRKPVPLVPAAYCPFCGEKQV